MENETPLGQPIPTAVLTPTEIIIAPAASVTPELSAEASRAVENLEPDATQTDYLIELMFAPLKFWTSVSASYLRVFDPTDHSGAVLQPYH